MEFFSQVRIIKYIQLIQSAITALRKGVYLFVVTKELNLFCNFQLLIVQFFSGDRKWASASKSCGTRWSIQRMNLKIVSAWNSVLSESRLMHRSCSNRCCFRSFRRMFQTGSEIDCFTFDWFWLCSIELYLISGEWGAATLFNSSLRKV